MKKSLFKHILVPVCSLFFLSSCTGSLNFGNSKNSNVYNFIDVKNENVLLTFNPNGGELVGNEKIIKISTDQTLSDLGDRVPTVKRDGVKNQPNWYYMNGVDKVVVDKNTTKFTVDTELLADWKEYTVTFDPNGGTFADGTTSSKSFSNRTVVHHDEISVPTKKYTTFTGWYVSDTAETPVSFPYSPSGDSTNITLKARYAVPNVTLAFNAGDGNFSDNSKVKYIQVSSENTWADIWESQKNALTPTIDVSKEKIFNSYKLNGAAIDDSTKFSKSTMIKASYDAAIQYTFDVNGGTWSDSTTAQKKSSMMKTSELKTFGEVVSDTIGTTMPTKGSTPYQFLGWYDNADSKGSAINDSTKYEHNKTIYACYKIPYLITFTGNIDTSGSSFSLIRGGDYEFTITAKSGKKLKLKDGTTTQEGSYSLKSAIDEGYGTTIEYTVNTERTSGTFKVKNAPASKIEVTVDTDTNVFNVSGDSSASSLIDYTGAGDKEVGSSVTFSAAAKSSITKSTVTISGMKAYKSGDESTVVGTSTSSSITFTMPNYSVIVKPTYTHTVNVTFNAYGGTPEPSTQSITYNTTATKPATDPKIFGKNFTGWYLNESGTGSAFDFTNTKLTEHTTLHAIYGNPSMTIVEVGTNINHNLDPNPSFSTYSSTMKIKAIKGSDNVTSLATWTSSDEAVATVAKSGTGESAVATITAVGGGCCTITCSYTDASQTTYTETYDKFSCGSFSKSMLSDCSTGNKSIADIAWTERQSAQVINPLKGTFYFPYKYYFEDSNNNLDFKYIEIFEGNQSSEGAFNECAYKDYYFPHILPSDVGKHALTKIPKYCFSNLYTYQSSYFLLENFEVPSYITAIDEFGCNFGNVINSHINIYIHSKNIGDSSDECGNLFTDVENMVKYLYISKATYPGGYTPTGYIANNYKYVESKSTSQYYVYYQNGVDA